MKKILYITLFLFTLVVQAQNEQLANNYFDRGEFEKALVNYEDLLKIPVLEIQKMIKELSKKECSMIISSPTSQDRYINVNNYSEINDEMQNKTDSTFILIKCF
jgi:hypothetical protein